MRLPSPEVIDEAFERLANEPNKESIRRLLARVAKDYEIINVTMGRGKPFWRAQLSDAAGFPFASRLHYPPKELACIGRMNESRSPRLYLSSRIEGALAEIGARDGDYVHLAGFRIRPDKKIRSAVIGEWAHVHKTGYLRLNGVDPGNSVSRVLNGLGKTNGLRMMYIDAHLGSILSERDAGKQEYLQTRCIAAHVFDRLPGVSGIFYPSVKRDLAMNLVVLPAAADDCFEQCLSMVVRVNKVLKFGLYETEVVRAAKGISEQQQYEWKDDRAPDEYFMFNITEHEKQAAPEGPVSLLDLPSEQVGALRKIHPVKQLLRHYALQFTKAFQSWSG